MGGDDDDGLGAVQMGAPKVKPRPGGRATLQADDDDEMGGGGDDDDFARGLSALERAKAARLQAERDRQAAERERLRLERETKRDTRGAVADTDQADVDDVPMSAPVDLGLGWMMHGAAPARPVAAEAVEDELARTLTLALHRTLTSKARRQRSMAGDGEYAPGAAAEGEEDDLVVNMEQLLQSVTLRQRRRRPEEEAKAAAAAAAAAAVVLAGRGSVAAYRSSARRKDTRHDPLAAVQKKLERAKGTAEVAAVAPAVAAAPAAVVPRQCVRRTTECDGVTVRRRAGTLATAATAAVPKLKLEAKRGSSMMAAAAAVVVRTPRVATPRLREGSVVDDRSALIAPLRHVLALAVRLPRTYLLAATEPPAAAVAEAARLRRDAMRALEVLPVTPHADAQRTLDELRERLERAFAAVPPPPPAAAPAATPAATSAHATAADAASATKAGRQGARKLIRAGGFAPRDAAVLAVNRKLVRPSEAPPAASRSIDRKLDAAAAVKEVAAAREAAATAREEAAMLAWVRGLQLPPLVTESFDGVSLSEACTSGLLLLAVADHLNPGAVEWGRTHAAAPHVWQRAANCAEALAVFGALGFRDAASVVKPADLALGAAAPRARALLWLLMRQEMLNLAGTARGGGSALIGWANRRVGEADAGGGGGGGGGGGALRITRFDDPKLHTGFYLLRLLRVVAPAAVDATEIRFGATLAEAEANAKLLVPSAQALLAGNAKLQRRASLGGSGGGAVFASWEDVVECRPKMLLCLLASLKCEDERRVAAANRKASLPLASARSMSRRGSDPLSVLLEFGSFFMGSKHHGGSAPPPPPGAPPPPPGPPPPPPGPPPPPDGSRRNTTVEVPTSHAEVVVEVAGGASPGGRKGGKQEHRLVALLLAPMRRGRALFRSHFSRAA